MKPAENGPIAALEAWSPRVDPFESPRRAIDPPGIKVSRAQTHTCFAMLEWANVGADLPRR